RLEEEGGKGGHSHGPGQAGSGPRPPHADREARAMTDQREEGDMLLNAYFDGELDAVAARRFEARLATEPDLAADLARLKRLRGRLRADIAEDLPPETLRRSIAARFATPPLMRARSWQALAASL